MYFFPCYTGSGFNTEDAGQRSPGLLCLHSSGHRQWTDSTQRLHLGALFSKKRDNLISLGKINQFHALLFSRIQGRRLYVVNTKVRISPDEIYDKTEMSTILVNLLLVLNFNINFVLKVTIYVTDENDNAPWFQFVSPDKMTVSEDAPLGTAVGRMQVIDGDLGQNAEFEYSITQANIGR